MQTGRVSSICRNPWITPIVSVAFGLVFLGAQWYAGDPSGGLVSLAIMCVFALLLVALSSRSEMIQIIRATDRDERQSMIDMRATAFAGLVLTVAVIAGAFWEIAQGKYGTPYTSLGALAGIAYLVGLVIARRRS